VIEMVRTGRIAMVRGNSRAVIRSSEPLSGDLIADDVSNCSV
jgi:hypothetical protein